MINSSFGQVSTTLLVVEKALCCVRTFGIYHSNQWVKHIQNICAAGYSVTFCRDEILAVGISQCIDYSTWPVRQRGHLIDVVKDSLPLSLEEFASWNAQSKYWIMERPYLSRRMSHRWVIWCKCFQNKGRWFLNAMLTPGVLLNRFVRLTNSKVLLDRDESLLDAWKSWYQASKKKKLLRV